MTAHAFVPVAEIPLSPTARVYEEGWQSWSPTGWYPAQAARSARPQERWQHQMRFRAGTPLPEDGFQAEGLLVVDPGEDAPAQVVLGVDPSRVPSIRATRRGEVLVVSADGPAEIGTAAEPGTALARAGERLADIAGQTAIRPTPTAWCTWYRYFEAVTEADVGENTAAIAAQELPVDVIQLDDGWSEGIGDWTPNTKFASLPALVQRIRDAGHRAGIWIAPFTVGSGTALAAAHPDWLVGPAGTNWNQQLLGLDVTHPDAADHLRSVLGRLREAGFDYFKLDFLYTGAVPGNRYADASGEEAYRQGLRLVRESLGEDAYLVGCGAPLLPSIGLIDAMRVSPDTFHEGAEDGSAGLRGAPGALARRWQHGRLWTNDADCLVARPSFSGRAKWAAVIERCGGLRSASDRIVELDSWGLETTRRVLSTAPGPDPFPVEGGHQ